MRISDSAYGLILSLPGIILTFALVILPVAGLVGLSFTQYNFINPTKFIGYRNYSTIFSDRLFPHSLKVTAIYTLGVTLLSLALSLIIATGLHKIGEKGLATLYRTLAILTFAVPLVLSGLVWRWLLDPGVGVMNYLITLVTPFEKLNIFGNASSALIGVILADAWVKTPFMTIFILAAMDSIDPELEDAARIDGASTVQRFRYILLPLSRRGILYAIFITAMFSFRTIDVIYAMTRGGPGKATYHIGLYIVDILLSLMHIGESAAVGMIVFLCILAFGTPMLLSISKRS